MARRLPAHGKPGIPDRALQLEHTLDPIEKEPGVACILEVGGVSDTGRHDGADGLGQRVEPGRSGQAPWMPCGLRRIGTRGPFVAGREAAQAGLDGLARASDRFLARRPVERQSAGTRHRAEKHRVDDRAVLLREHQHVEEGAVRGHRVGRLQDARAVVAPVAHRTFFRHRELAVGGCAQHRALARYVPCLDGAARLDQLRRRHQVEPARRGRQRQHRFTPSKLGARHRVDLDVVGRCARALRDSRDRGALHRESPPGGRVDQPVGQNTAALAAHGCDQDTDRARHCTSSEGVRVLRASRPITAPRMPAMKRSQRPGFWTMSAL